MQRKIKCRVWLKTLERFATKDEWILDLDGDLFYNEYVVDLNQFIPVLVPEDNYVGQQFTGLFDKNGNEICEGDVLERIGNGSFCKIVVGWNYKECCFVYNNVSNLHGSPSPLHDNFVNLCDWTYWVVCGNIFENSELIKQ